MKNELLEFYRDQVRSAATEAELKKAQFQLQRLEDSLEFKPQYLARRQQEGK